MNKGVIAIEITKFIVQHCERVKHEFERKLNELFASQQIQGVIPEIPVKRSREPSVQDSEEEIEYKSGSLDLFSKGNEEVQKGDEEGKDMGKESSDELFVSESGDQGLIVDVAELEALILDLKTKKIEKSDLERITCFLDTYSSMGLKERSSLKNVLAKFDGLRVDKADLQTKTMFSELQGKVKKVKDI